jgi:hypothetical protein
MANWISLTLDTGGKVLLNCDHLVSVQERAETHGLCRSLLTTVNSVFNVREKPEEISSRASLTV